MKNWIVSILGVLLFGAAFADEPPKSGKYWVFLGTYTGGKGGSKGIYRCEFDAADGSLSKPELAAEVTNPTFLAIHPNGKLLYSVGETDQFNGKRGGSVHAFEIDSKTGALRALNVQPSIGAGPCHIIVDPDGKNVLTANYGSGSVTVLPIKADGSLEASSCLIQHEGKSANPQRQEGPHAHSVNFDPGHRFVVAADLGLDKVLVYRFDAASGKLSPNDPPFLKLAGGSGPRHFAFHQTKPWAYVINELACTINALHYTPEGKFEIVQKISTIPGAVKPEYSTAEVQVHKSGKFVYGSNRGQNSIACFQIDQSNGKLNFIARQGEGINVPRAFGIDPTGQFMLVANQDGHTVIGFKIDQDSGELKPIGVKIEVGSPVCVKFLAK